MSETINKLDESRFEIVKEPVLADPVIETYSIDELKQRELDILKSINDFVEKRQAELVEVRALIAEVDKFGLKTKEQILADNVIIEEEKVEGIIN